MGALMKLLTALTCFSGVLAQALWMAALERQDPKRERFYARLTLYCYALCVLTIALDA